ncbi:MAG: sulfite exporter TauE/SafE family protein [Methylovirgula sp.]
MTFLSDILSVLSGLSIGFVLSLIGGGGSVLATPLLVYVVGVKSPHVAIGTGAIAVAVNAFANLIGHAREGHVKWNCALIFAASGFIGAGIGSTLGKHFDGQKLLLLFGIVMIVVAAQMFVNRSAEGNANLRLSAETARQLVPPLIGYGFAVGALSGFFGIGGGFLVVPGLVAATRMPLIMAVGSSLVSVTVFGATTAANYAISGLVDWHLVALFLVGGIVGGLVGGVLATKLSKEHRALSLIFAVVVAAVGFYVVYRGIRNLLGT